MGYLVSRYCEQQLLTHAAAFGFIIDKAAAYDHLSIFADFFSVYWILLLQIYIFIDIVKMTGI